MLSAKIIVTRRDVMTNKELILKFYEEVFNSWDVSNIREYMREDYMQHSAGVEDGLEGFLKFADVFLAMKPHMEIYNVLENENHVALFFKCTLENGMVNKVMDLYRIEDGKLAEHWDVVEHDIGGKKSKSGRELF